jgi:hypothetical protein
MCTTATARRRPSRAIPTCSTFPCTAHPSTRERVLRRSAERAREQA